MLLENLIITAYLNKKNPSKKLLILSYIYYKNYLAAKKVI